MDLLVCYRTLASFFGTSLRRRAAQEIATSSKRRGLQSAPMAKRRAAVLATALLQLCTAWVPPVKQQRSRERRAAQESEDVVYAPPTDPLYVTPEALFPTSYVLPISRRVKNSIKAQWFADWRAIADCFLRFPDPRRRLDGSEGLASRLSTACSNELQFVPSGPRRLPSPFALSLIDRAFHSAYLDPARHARLRDYVLDQYVPGQFGDVCERLGSWRVAEAVRMSMGSPLDARPRRLQTFFDPLTPEYDAMVRCHNVEYPIKHPDWRRIGLPGGLGLDGPCD